MSEAEQTRRPIECRTIVVAVAEFGIAGMHGNAHTNRCRLGPRFGAQRALNGQRRFQCIRSRRKDGQEAVSRHLYDAAAMTLDAVPQQCVMAGQRGPHRLALGVPKTGAALDVGEQKREGAGGKAGDFRAAARRLVAPSYRIPCADLMHPTMPFAQARFQQVSLAAGLQSTAHRV